jgi:hypothetical protein
MSEADKLFEELGYKKIENIDCLYYQKQEKCIEMDIYIFIGFDLEKEKIDIYTQDITKGGRYEYITTVLSMQELKAINMKCKELRMEW